MADFFRGRWAGEGRILWGRTISESRSNCTRPEAVMGVVSGGDLPSRVGGPGGITPWRFFLFLSVRMCISEC